MHEPNKTINDYLDIIRLYVNIVKSKEVVKMLTLQSKLWASWVIESYLVSVVTVTLTCVNSPMSC